VACPYFVDGPLCRCSAVRGLLVPSLHERERFCTTESSGSCPTFRVRVTRDSALPEEVYYALWLPVERAPEEESPRPLAPPR
jgi:hypothetical protein